MITTKYEPNLSSFICVYNYGSTFTRTTTTTAVGKTRADITKLFSPKFPRKRKLKFLLRPSIHTYNHPNTPRFASLCFGGLVGSYGAISAIIVMTVYGVVGCVWFMLLTFPSQKPTDKYQLLLLVATSG